MHSVDKKLRKTPYIVATGFTTAFLGDERTLREFIVGDLVKNAIEQKGGNAVLYLINDSYDPLNHGQLRVAVNKDEKLLKMFEGFCGRPISEVPDPFGCHDHCSQHNEKALLQRLWSLNIHPVIMDSYRAYRSGYYDEMIATTFANYAKIQEMLARTFGLHMANDLFRAKCPKCLCIDATHIKEVKGQVIRFDCERCGTSSRQETTEIQGKLSWKLDCAARWNLYKIDIETFSKAHLAESGSFEIARFMSQHFYGGRVPAPIKYGDVKISRDLSYKLLEILPPRILKKVFTTHMTRDLDLNRDFIDNFCRQYPIRPGLSYVDYIRKELPIEALRLHNKIESDNGPNTVIDTKTLVTYGNRFSKFFYNKEYELRLPDVSVIRSADQATAQMAQRVIGYSLSVRNNLDADWKKAKTMIKSFLFTQKVSPQLYHFLRRIFGQVDGPNITTLLAILPAEYLRLTQMVLASYTEDAQMEAANRSEIVNTTLDGVFSTMQIDLKGESALVTKHTILPDQ